MKLQKNVAINYSLAAGILASAAVIVVAVVHSTTNYFLLINIAAMAIVFGGLASTSVIMLPAGEMVELGIKLFRFLRYGQQSGGALAAMMVQAAVAYSRFKDFKSIEKVINPRIFEALELIEAGFRREDVQRILEIKKDSTLNRSFTESGLLLTLSKLAPGFGLVGTLIGLIVMLYDMGSGDLDRIGPAMAIALTATLYGVVSANMIFLPLAEFITHRSESVSRLDELIQYGVGAIMDGRHPVQIRETLRAYLSKPEQLEFDRYMQTTFSEPRGDNQPSEGVQVA